MTNLTVSPCRHRSVSVRARAASLALLAATTGVVHVAGAAIVPVSWTAAVNGVWTDATKWTPVVVPNNGADTYNVTIGVTGSPYLVSLDPTPINVSTLTIDSSTATLSIGAGNSLTVPGRLISAGTDLQNGGTLTIPTGSGSTVTNLRASARYYQSAGTFNFGTNLNVGINTGDTARYELSGTGLLSGTQLNVGANLGAGTFVQSGGRVTLSTYLALGDDSGFTNAPKGQYELSAGTLSAAQQYVGASGVGTFVQTGGHNNIPAGGQNFLAVGEDATSSGTYSLSGGSMTISALVLGRFGNGTFLHSGGSNTIGGVMRVGRDIAGDGYYNLSAGTLAVAGEVDLGYGAETSGGIGTFDQSGGVFNASSVIYLGKNNGAAGTYKMSGGNFTVPTEVVGNVGNGSFNQTGGTHVVNGTLAIKAGVGTGAMSLTGGTLQANSTTLNGSFTGGGNAVATLGPVSGAGSMPLGGNVNVTANYVRIASLSLANTATLTIAQNGSAAAVSTLSSLSISDSAVLDLFDNDLIVSPITPMSDIESYVRNFYNFGNLNGTGAIQSTTARNASPQITMLGVISGAEYFANANDNVFDGIVTVAGDTLVKYTYYGDVDFNGQVDTTDYNIIDFGFLTGLTGWANGDVDYNGQVDTTDYNLIDFAFLTQSGMLRRAVSYMDGSDRSMTGMNDPSLQKMLAHYDQFGEAYAQGFLAQVPEPATISFAGLLATSLMLKRRRRARAVHLS